MGLDMYLLKTKRVSIDKFKEVNNVIWSDGKYNEFSELTRFRDKILKLEDKEIITFYEGMPIYAKRYSSLDNVYFSLTMEVAYWRKANAVHSWFVREVQNNVDDCGEYDVSKEKLIQLRDLCFKVLDENESDLLNPQSGFFFGSTEKDEWYYNYLQNTIDMVDLILNTTNFETEMILYSSSW